MKNRRRSSFLNFPQTCMGKSELKNKKSEKRCFSIYERNVYIYFFVENVGSKYLIVVSGSKKVVRENENRRERD